MNKYNKIKDYLREEGLEQMYVEQFHSLENICRDYYYVYLIYSKVAGSTLKNYVSPELYLNRKKEDNEQDENTNRDICDMLYVEFFTKIFENCNKKISWSSVINNPDEIEALIIDYFGRKDVLTTYISKAVQTYYTKTNAPINLTNLHKSISDLQSALETPKPSIEESVLAVIADQKLQELYNDLISGNSTGYMSFYMKIAPIRRAIYDGAYHKYTFQKDNCQQFLNINCDHNYKELYNYIFSNMNEGSEYQGLLGILNDYETTYADLYN